MAKKRWRGEIYPQSESPAKLSTVFLPEINSVQKTKSDYELHGEHMIVNW
jgi:hypothetical protein